MNQSRIDEHFAIALYELEQGITFAELRDIIKEYEDIEDYEVCAGIYKAVDYVSFHTLTQVSKQLENKIELNYD
jgi:hypothetical protein